MLKILHIAKPLAGVGVYISLLAKHIDKTKFSNIIICNENDDIITIEDSQNKRIKHYHCEIIRDIKIINDLKCFFKIIKVIRKEKPDIIHCHSAKSGILGRLAGFFTKSNTLYTPHAYSYLSTNSKVKRFFLKKIEEIFGFLPSKTLTCSFSEYQRALYDLKIKNDKILLWNNSIENNFVLKDTNILEELPDKFICSIGRPSFQKNSEFLVKVISEIKKTNKDIHLVIMGVGFYSPKLKEIKEEILKLDLSENITLIPWLNRSVSLSVLEKSLIYISCSRYEGLPYSVIEALSLGKPCVLTSVDGNKDLVKEGYNGFLVDFKAKEMAKKINLIMQDQALAKQMGNNSRIEFEKFYNLKKNIKTLENIYTKILLN